MRGKHDSHDSHTSFDEDRFKFGQNWLSYTKTLDTNKIDAAEKSLRVMLGSESLENRSFLDAGCGSGLFSLAAKHLGASPVVSFDYDPDSVHCTEKVRGRYGETCTDWKIIHGDVLDAQWLADLGQFDIVYSWGVLHHTGTMWKALDNLCASVKPGGTLFISIYNDRGWISRFWRKVKRIYTRGGLLTKIVLTGFYVVSVVCVRTVRGIGHLENPGAWYGASERGMNIWHDAIDWVGGYPFETATSDEVQGFVESRRFKLSRLTRKSGSGCNEFVFDRTH